MLYWYESGNKKVDGYEHSSYNDYVNIDSSFIDKDFVYGLISKDGFIEFNNEINDDKCLDIDDYVFRISDEDARKIIMKIAGSDYTTELQLYSQEDRNKCIKKMKDKGLSIRQISRLTGVSFAIVRNI